MTILVQWEEDGGWVTHLENGDLNQHTTFDEDDRPHRAVIIQHPPIETWSDRAAYKAVTTDETIYDYFRTIPGEVKSTTLNKGHKKIITSGIEKVQREDYAVWAALSSEVTVEKVMLMITDDATRRSLENSVGQVAEFYEPGYNAIEFNEEDLQRRIDDMNPHKTTRGIHLE